MKKLYLVILLSFLAHPVFSEQQTGALPFTQEQNVDGSKFVWFILAQSNFNYDYVITKNLPKSKWFRKVSKQQVGDIAWWPKYMALTVNQKEKPISIATVGNEYNYKELTRLYGKPYFYRYQVLE